MSQAPWGGRKQDSEQLGWEYGLVAEGRALRGEAADALAGTPPRSHDLGQFLKCALWTTTLVSAGNLLEMQTLRSNPDLLNQTLGAEPSTLF